MLNLSRLVVALFHWRSCGPAPLRLWITVEDYAQLTGDRLEQGDPRRAVTARRCAGVPVSLDRMHGGPGSRVVFEDGSSVALERVCGGNRPSTR